MTDVDHLSDLSKKELISTAGEVTYIRDVDDPFSPIFSCDHKVLRIDKHGIAHHAPYSGRVIYEHGFEETAFPWQSNLVLAVCSDSSNTTWSTELSGRRLRNFLSTSIWGQAFTYLGRTKTGGVWVYGMHRGDRWSLPSSIQKASASACSDWRCDRTDGERREDMNTTATTVLAALGTHYEIGFFDSSSQVLCSSQPIYLANEGGYALSKEQYEGLLDLIKLAYLHPEFTLPQLKAFCTDSTAVTFGLRP